jgi:hypothetical protein
MSCHFDDEDEYFTDLAFHLSRMVSIHPNRMNGHCPFILSEWMDTLERSVRKMCLVLETEGNDPNAFVIKHFGKQCVVILMMEISNISLILRKDDGNV